MTAVWTRLHDETKEECASVSCGHSPASWRMDAGGVGSFFCDDCRRKIRRGIIPAEPGFYYFRHQNAPTEHIWTAQVSRVRSGELFATVFASLSEHRIEHTNVSEIRGLWFGPLPSPESMGA